MNIKKHFLFGVLCILVSLTFYACGYTAGDIGGTPVTPEMLDSLSRSLEQTVSEPTVSTDSQLSTSSLQPSQTAIPIETTTETSTDTVNTTVSDVVFWTEAGSVYHYSSDCSSLRSAEHILQGSIEDALSAKKERACKRCS